MSLNSNSGAIDWTGTSRPAQMVDLTEFTSYEDEDDYYLIHQYTSTAAQYNRSDAVNGKRKRRRHEEQDLLLAWKLQREEEQLAASRRKAQQEAEQSMLSSTTGKAWKFVAEVLDLHKNLSSTHRISTSMAASSKASHTIAPVALDDLVLTTERLLQAQTQFRTEGRPFTVDIGYHYTSSDCLSSIQKDGLMSRPERDAKNIKNSRFHGAAYGEGIYTAKDVSTVHGSYGDICLLVARLTGHVALSPQGNLYNCNNNSVLVVSTNNNEEHFLVLQKSCQCIPLIQFPTNFVVAFQPDRPGNKIVHEYHVHLQHLCDKFFNESKCTVVKAPSSQLTAAARSQKLIAKQQQSQALMQQSQQRLALLQNQYQRQEQENQSKGQQFQLPQKIRQQQQQQLAATLRQYRHCRKTEGRQSRCAALQTYCGTEAAVTVAAAASLTPTSTAKQPAAATASTALGAFHNSSQPGAVLLQLPITSVGTRHFETPSSSQLTSGSNLAGLAGISAAARSKKRTAKQQQSQALMQHSQQRLALLRNQYRCQKQEYQRKRQQYHCEQTYQLELQQKIRQQQLAATLREHQHCRKTQGRQSRRAALQTCGGTGAADIVAAAASVTIIAKQQQSQALMQQSQQRLALLHNQYQCQKQEYLRRRQQYHSEQQYLQLLEKKWKQQEHDW